MRGVFPLLIVALLAGTAMPAEAQDVTLYLDGGFALPSDPPEFGELWNVGFGAGAGAGFRLSPDWEVVGSFHYQHFPADEAAQAEEFLLTGFGTSSTIEKIEGRDATALTLLMQARFHVPTESRRWLPFLSFGWGYFDFSTSDAMVTPTRDDLETVPFLGENDAAFGVLAGGGIEVAVGGRTRVFLDALYTIGFVEPVSAQYLPLRVGVGIGL